MSDGTERQDTYALVVELFCDDPNFARGFEAGKLYGEMRSGAAQVEGTYHVENEEQFIHFAQHFGYEVTERTVLDDAREWIAMTFRRQEPVGVS